MDIKKLLNEMTLAEKIGQCVQLPGDYFGINGEITGPLEGYELSPSQIFAAGSTLGVTGSENVRKLQEKYLENSRLKIPLLIMADIIHGYETIFPIPLAMASSFNPDVIKKASKVAAAESYASGVHVTFSPMTDIVRDARWGRVLESCGEDPKLAADLSKAYVQGYQGDSFENKNTIASCVKHFAGYGAAEGGREYNTVDMSERVFRETYLSGYKAATDENARLVMTSFNTVNSVPATVNKWLLTNVLREEMKFDGVVISDWSSVKEVIAHGVARDEAHAGVKAMDAGCDIEMSSACYYAGLEQGIEDGKLSIEQLDQAVLRILQLKEDLGLFADPYRGCDQVTEKSIILSEDHRHQALDVALNSMVLLKNENNVLPLKQKQKIALVGPNVRERDMNGAWSWRGHADNGVLLSEVLKNDFEIILEDEFVIEEKLLSADVVIYCGGEKNYMSGEAASRTDITLPFNQEAEIKRIKQFGKKVVLVNYSGRPIAFSNIVNDVDAILQAWFGGTMTNQAVAKILKGEFNPVGKLPISFPRVVGQCPIYYNCLNTGRPYKPGEIGFTSKYLDVDNSPLYQFGFGLNYSQIKIKEVNVKSEIELQENLKVSVVVQNDSDVEGTELVQVYYQDPVAEVARPIKQLVAYEHVTLASNEQKTIDIDIDFNNLKYLNLDNEWVIEPGTVKLMVGLSSNSTFEQIIEIKE